MISSPEANLGSADSPPKPANAYAAALMEAVHRQPRLPTGLGSSYEPASRRVPAPGQTVTRPTPIPKRPKGRLFLGTILFLICGGGALVVWNSLFRYQAYGMVTGRVVQLAAPWGGVLECVLVREGEPVRQGQRLAIVTNPELDRQVLDKLDELKIAQAALEAELGHVRFQALLRDDSVQRTFADYYELWGQLLQEQSLLADLEAKRERAESLNAWELMTEERLDELRFAETGQRARIEKLSQAVEEMKLHFDKSATGAEDLDKQLRPFALRVEAIQSEIQRLRENTSLKELRAPTNGRVVAVRRFAGEYSDADLPVFDILVDGSLEVALYVAQKDSQAFHAGRILEVHVPAERELVKCVVVRVGDQYEPAPQSVELHYQRNEKLLPVYARPLRGSEGASALRLGTEVRLPYEAAPLSLLAPRAL